jgi:hypothetical protein
MRYHLWYHASQIIKTSKVSYQGNQIPSQYITLNGLALQSLWVLGDLLSWCAGAILLNNDTVLNLSGLAKLLLASEVKEDGLEGVGHCFAAFPERVDANAHNGEEHPQDSD